MSTQANVGAIINGILRNAWTENARNMHYWTNKSGGSVTSGDVVVLDTTTAQAFKTTTTSGDTTVVGVVPQIDTDPGTHIGALADQTIANNAAGYIQFAGDISKVTVDATTAIGNFLIASATTKKASPVTAWQPGVFAVATSACTGAGTVSAKLLPTNAYTPPLDGWTADTDTWVYVSANSFKITGKDVTARFPVGTKIKLTQTTAKYFYVTAVAFGTDTTVTVQAGADYTVANVAITLPCYSYHATPQGFPDVFLYTPTWAGGTGQPATSLGRFSIVGRKVLLTIMGAAVTSNATTFTVSLPVNARTAANAAWVALCGEGADNGVPTTAPPYAKIVSGASVIDLYKDAGKTAWTNVNNKFVQFITIMYEI